MWKFCRNFVKRIRSKKKSKEQCCGTCNLRITSCNNAKVCLKKNKSNESKGQKIYFYDKRPKFKSQKAERKTIKMLKFNQNIVR